MQVMRGGDACVRAFMRLPLPPLTLTHRSALHHAVIGRHFEVNLLMLQMLLAQMLLSQTLLSNDVRINTRLQVVQVLLSYEARVNAQDVFGNTPLHYAAENRWALNVQNI